MDAVGISYMITGGVASVIYGDPRFTRDVDLVMELPPSEITTLQSAFDRGAYYVPPAEALEEEAARPEALQVWTRRLDLESTLEEARRFALD